MSIKIIGITGTLGAGKGTIVDYLIDIKGFQHYSVRKFLIDEINKRGLEVNRDSMTDVANDLRRKHTPSFIIEELYKRAAKSGKNTIIESIRTPGEIDFLEKQGNFMLIAVDADPKIRYERITLRGSETDRISFDTFVANEKREISTNDPNKQNLSACIKRADILLVNNGSIEELTTSLQKKLNE